jgi:glycosyltransferase involved in cell wall biosynthesis
MRILLLNSEYPPIGGGAGNASANLAHCLAQMGHSVTVLTARWADLPQREQNGNLTVIRIPALRRRQDRSGALEQLLFILSASFSSLKLVRLLKPNATLAFFGMPSGVVALLLKWMYGIPYIVSLRGGDVPGFRPYDFSTYHKLIAPLLRVIWQNASAIVANSHGLRELAMKFDARFDIPIIPNGVDLDLYRASQHEHATPRLFSAGRVVHQKGLDLALRALAGLKDLDWEWRIAGDGPQLDFLKLLAQEMGIAERVTFLGWQARDQLIEQYRWSNLFLFPSRHEGMPNAVLEAMASGLPVIASRIAGSEELVLDGETGLLFPSEEVNALRAALKRLLTDPTLRQSMGAASRRRVEEHYSWESAAKQYVHLLERIPLPLRERAG